MIWLLVLTFLCGAIYEAGCVLWVHHTESGNSKKAAFYSMLVALITCIGLGEALHKPLFIIAYVLGYGAGTYLTVRFKSYFIGKM